ERVGGVAGGRGGEIEGRLGAAGAEMEAARKRGVRLAGGDGRAGEGAAARGIREGVGRGVRPAVGGAAGAERPVRVGDHPVALEGGAGDGVEGGRELKGADRAIGDGALMAAEGSVIEARLEARVARRGPE